MEFSWELILLFVAYKMMRVKKTRAATPCRTMVSESFSRRIAGVNILFLCPIRAFLSGKRNHGVMSLAAA